MRRQGTRVLGIDFGEKRIGLAISDALGSAAQPLDVVERHSVEDDIERIGEVARRRRVNKIVMGLPLNMHGSVGPQARRVRRFASRLRRALGLDVAFWDERLTSAEAERALLEAGQRRARRRAVRDAVAAAVLLQGYLDSQRGGSEQ